MADKSQQIKTDLIFNAQNAINNIKELSGLLDKINGFSFNRTKQGMDSFAKAIQQASEAAVKGATAGAKATKTQSDEEQKVQNLIQKRTQLIKEMTDAYSKNNNVDLSKQITQLEALNNKVANMYVAMGQASNAVKFLKEALENLDSSSGAFKLYQKDDIAQRIADIKKLQQANDDYVKSAMGQPTSVEKAAEKQRKEQERQQKELERLTKQQEREQKRIEQEEQRGYDQRVKNLATFAKEAQAGISSIEKNLAILEKGKGLYSDTQLNKDLANLTKISTALRAVFGKNDAQNLFGPSFNELYDRMTNLSSTGENKVKLKLSQGAFEQATASGDIQKVLSDLKKKMQSAKYEGNEDLYNGYLEQYKRYSEIVRQVNEDIKKLNQTKKQEADTAKSVTNTVISEEEKQQKEFQKKLQKLEQLNAKYDEIKRSIENHSGADGLSYSQAGLNNMIARIESLSNAYAKIGADNYAKMLNPSMLSGVNTTIGRFNSQLADARVKAQELYMTFQKTKDEADRLRFIEAKNDFVKLNDEAEKFDKLVSKTRRDVVSIGNLTKRAKESFNWMVGSQIENTIAGFPFEVVDKVKNFELEMAGIAQVLPKVESGQAAANQEFQNFANIAGQYGQSVENTLTAAKSLGRMYGGTEETADIGARNTEILTAQAAKMATTDNFDMVAATQGLESALSQFNMQTEDSNLLLTRSTHILDVWTKLAHTSGASAQDLTEGVKQAGASAQEAGVSFEFLNALIATGVRTTAKSGNEIGTMLKSLFASMQGDKAIKAMQDFGIEVYKVGATGKKELRPLQDLILDVSKALQTTNKDTKGISDFLLAISGGKFQVSKVAALLGNYKELQRTIQMAGDSAGFTDKQLKLQMDTISRRVETLKSNISQLFQQSGSNGLSNDLKWVLDVIIKMTDGMKNSTVNTYQWVKAIIKVVAAYKLLPPLIKRVATYMGRVKAAWELQNRTSSSGGSIVDSAKNAKDRLWSTPKKVGYDEAIKASNTSSSVANTSARAGNTSAINTQNVAITAQNGLLSKNSSQLSINSSAQRIAGNTAKTSALSMVALNKAQQQGRVVIVNSNRAITSHVGNLKKMGSSAKIVNTQVKASATTLNRVRGSVMSASRATKALSSATSFLGSAAKVVTSPLMVLVSLFKGFSNPVSAAITVLSLLATALSVYDEAQGDAIEKQQELQESLQNTITTAEEHSEEIEKNTQEALELTAQYNALVDSLKEVQQSTNDSSEAKAKEAEITQEMGTIEDRIAKLLHANSIQKDKDGKINQQTIKDLAQADKDATAQQVNDATAQMLSQQNATDEHKKSVENRISYLKGEVNATDILSRAYTALFKVITMGMKIVGETEKVIANTLAGKAWSWLTMGKSQEWADELQRDAYATLSAAEARREYAEEHDGENLRALHELEEQNAELERIGSVRDDIESLQSSALAKIQNPKSSDLIDPTGQNRNADKEGTQPKEKKTRTKNPKGKKGKNPAYQKEEWTYGDEASRVMTTIVKDLNKEGWESRGVTVQALMAYANAISGRNGTYWDNLVDVFGTGAGNVWDSGFDFKNKLIDQFQQGKTMEEAFKALAPNVSDSYWHDVWGGDKNYVQYLTDHYNVSKFDKDFTGDDPYLKRQMAGGASGGPYDFSQFDNPYLAQLAVKVSNRVQELNGKYIAPNLIYGQYMAETPDVTEFTTKRWIGGLKDSYTNEDEFVDDAARTYVNGSPYGSMFYWQAQTATDFYNVGHANQYPEDNNENGAYTASLDQHANEKAWFNGSSMAGVSNVASQVVDDAVTSLGAVADETNNCVKTALAILRQIPQFANDALANSGIVNGDTLVDWVKNNPDSGWKVIDYDASQATPGALVTWYGSEGTNSHTGIIAGTDENGDVQAYDASSSNAHQPIKRSVAGHESWGQTPEYLILPPSALQGSSIPNKGNYKPQSRWVSAEGTLQGWKRDIVSEYAKEQEMTQNRYEMAKKHLEIEEKLFGESASLNIAKQLNEERSLEASKNMADLWDSILDDQKSKITDYVNKFAGVRAAILNNGLQVKDIFNLPDEELESLAKSANDKNFEETVKSYIAANKASKEAMQGYDEKKANYDKTYNGYMSPEEKEDYRLQQIDENHRAATAQRPKTETWQLDQDYYVQKLDVLQDRYNRVQKDLEMYKRSDEARVDNYNLRIANNKESLNSLTNDYQDATDDEERKKIKKEIDEITKSIKDMQAARDQLSENGSEPYRKAEKELQSIKKEIDEVTNSINEAEMQLREKLGSGIADMFENIFLEGQTFKDSWKNLWKDIGKLAWEQLVKVNLLSNIQKWMGAISDLTGGGVRHRSGASAEMVGALMNTPLYGSSVIRGGYFGTGNRAGTRILSTMTGMATDGTFFPIKKPSAGQLAEDMAGTGVKNQLSANLKNFGKTLQDGNTVWKNLATPMQALGQTTPLLETATTQSRASLVQQIASTTLNTTALNANTAAQGSGSAISVGKIIPHANGGSLAGYASGGGLIQGAGTGTSDSILTYLAHQGRFIATSDGEYIVKKSTVDKLGTNYLDMLNNNPEAMAGLQRYADGGDLGVSYVPSMSPKTVDSYNSLNHNQAVIKMNSNKKLETLMQQQNDMISKMGSGDNNGGIVVLNTQADSASVMKALAKNPRAVQRILGGQKKHGFGR